MATTHPHPPGMPELARGTETQAREEALVPQVRMEAAAEAEAGTLSPAVAALPVELEVSIPVRAFRVRNLLTLECGSVIETQWSQGDDMPLAAGDVQLAWSEFEVVDAQLAVRVTRLA